MYSVSRGGISAARYRGKTKDGMPAKYAGAKGGSRIKQEGKPDVYRIGGQDIPYDPELDLDKPKPTPLFPVRKIRILSSRIILTSKRPTRYLLRSLSQRPKRYRSLVTDPCERAYTMDRCTPY